MSLPIPTPLHVYQRIASAPAVARILDLKMDSWSVASELRDIAEEEECEAFAVALWFQMKMIALATPPRGGSRPGKAANKDRQYAAAHHHYMERYFWPAAEFRPGTQERGPRESEHTFQRRFRMPRVVFDRVFDTVVLDSAYMRRGLRPDATGRIGITPLIKVIAAIRQLACAIPSHFCDDLFDISESTASECMFQFCKSVVHRFSGEYLRSPNSQDILRVEKQFRAVGFPGCIGCVDCAGWFWSNAPKAIQASLIGKDGKPCLRMEVVCDLDLWVWHFQFGFPGFLNDLDILQVGDHFSDFVSGAFPPSAPSYNINGETFQSFYYLSDEIYPKWKIFVTSLSNASSQKIKTFSKAQEAVRKCVKRVFDLLFRQFKVMFVASELWSPEKMEVIAKASIILHNMVVEKRRGSHARDGACGASAMYDAATDTTELSVVQASSEDVALRLQHMKTVSSGVKSVSENNRLVTALVEHIWRSRGRLGDEDDTYH